MRVFVGMDGDDVGATLVSLVIQNKSNEAALFSDRVIRGLRLVGDRIRQSGGKVFFIGGDNLLAELEFDRDLLHELQEIFKAETGCEVTIGVGRFPVEAYLALKLGKGRGKGQIVQFDEASVDEGR
jgi:GTP cyclohydrolase III